MKCKFCRNIKEKDETVQFRFVNATNIIIMCDKCFQGWDKLDKSNPFALTEKQREVFEDEMIKQINKSRKSA